MRVVFGDWLSAHFKDFDDDIRLKVVQFAIYVENNGLRGLKGRNKSSIPTNSHTKQQLKNAQFAQKHCLWHYHLGVPEYIEQRNGEFTSQYILHYAY